jgi:hypothetical protein
MQNAKVGSEAPIKPAIKARTEAAMKLVTVRNRG